MATLRAGRRVFLTLLLGYTGHVSFLEVRPYVNNLIFGTPIVTRFDKGSIDDKLSDMLHTGDVILYSRRWYTHHIPMALLIQLYQFTFDCYFDHMGVIVINPEDGTPFVLEQSEFSDRASFRRYDETVLMSQATQINCMRLQPVLQYTDASFAKLEDYMEEITRNKEGKNHSEFYGLLCFLTKYYCDKLFGKKDNSNDSKGKSKNEESIMCPSSNMMINAYNALGFNKSLVGGEYDPYVTVNNFVDNRIRLRCLKGPCEKKNDKSVTYGPIEVVRIK